MAKTRIFYALLALLCVLQGAIAAVVLPSKPSQGPSRLAGGYKPSSTYKEDM